jgi:ribosome recycling factor
VIKHVQNFITITQFLTFYHCYHRFTSIDSVTALETSTLRHLFSSPTPINPAAPLASEKFGQLRHYAKAPKKGKGNAAAASGNAEVATLDLGQYEKQMNGAIEHLQHELANIRTGRATPGMLDHLKIEAYGERVPMKAVGSVSVRDSQLLAVTLFDPGLVDAVVAGIAQSPLKLNPRAEGQEILVPVPSPTAETLTAMSKMCKSEGETAKVSVRHARKVALDAVKALGSEDERRKLEKSVQQLTDKFISEADELVAMKTKDIMKHNS